MNSRVFLTDDAYRDVEELYDYIESHDAPANAAYVLDQLQQVFSSLAAQPERGTCPRELSAIGLREYREIFFKPYRIIYRVVADDVYIMLVADGRRDMHALLQRRLIQG